MKKLLFVVSLVLLFCSVVYCQKQAEKPTTETSLNAVKEVWSAWGKALEAKDVDRICSLYADDLVVMPGDSLRDKTYARETWIKRFSEGVVYKMQQLDKVEVSASGDLAYTISGYDYTTMVKGEAKTGKYYALAVFKKQKDGSWKLIAIK